MIKKFKSLKKQLKISLNLLTKGGIIDWVKDTRKARKLMGLRGALRYNLGIAKEGVDFVTIDKSSKDYSPQRVLAWRIAHRDGHKRFRKVRLPEV